MTSEDRFRIATPPVIHQIIDGEVILVHLSLGTYHSLEGSAALLFDPLLHGATASELCALLSAATDGDETTIHAAVTGFLADLERDGLVVPAADAAPVVAVAMPALTRRPFVAPHVETFTDLQDLLTADPIHDVEPSGWPNLTPEGQSGR